MRRSCCANRQRIYHPHHGCGKDFLRTDVRRDQNRFSEGQVLSALDQGFEVYMIADACGDVSEEAHERAIERMVQAGARPTTSVQYLLELQRDWARTVTYDATTSLAR